MSDTIGTWKPRTSNPASSSPNENYDAYATLQGDTENLLSYGAPDYGLNHPDSGVNPGRDVDGGDNSSYKLKLYTRRWFMLAMGVLLSLCHGYQFLHLNVMADSILFYYNESIPGETSKEKATSVDWLSMENMVACIVLAIPYQYFLDKRGLRQVVLVSAIFTAAGALVKCAATSPDRFWVLMLGQVLNSSAQIWCIPVILAAKWFGPEEVSTATAMSIFGNQVGIGLGFLIPPYVVAGVDLHPTGNYTEENMTLLGYKLSYLYYGGAAVATAMLISIVFGFEEEPPSPPSLAQMQQGKRSEENYLESLKSFFTNVPYLLLMLTYGANIGSMYAIATLLEPIMLAVFDEEAFPYIHSNIGWMGFTMVTAGMVSAVLSGLWLDRTKLYKSTTLVMYVLCLLGLLALTFTLPLLNIGLTHAWIGFVGFFMNGYQPVGCEFAAELTYPLSEGTASSLLIASASAFGLILTLVMGDIIRNYNNQISVRDAMLCVCGALVVGIIGTVFIKDISKRQTAEGKKGIMRPKDAVELESTLLSLKSDQGQAHPEEDESTIHHGYNK